VDDAPLAGTRVLEIGLGYGTLGQRIAERGAIYHGLDIAEEPVGLMRMRLALLGIDDEAQARVQQGSALDLPFADASFDYVYTIGCLHHTGDVARGVEEVRRVLKPGGRAVVMLYHKHSFRQLVLVPRARLRTALRRNGRPLAERVRAMYDTNEAGDAAPHTDFVSRREVRRLFQGFQGVEVRARNFETYVLLRGRIVVRRERLLGNVDRLLGLDLYVVADR
jgi:SAM-dependent methyltransferase